ncbi:MAG: hypothetical protein Q9M30_05490 [Mariprofundaceae bacterium]|nr:hypothetical protein [Mariprofundaceae bacterium]
MTLGLALRIGDFPPAVMIPPAPVSTVGRTPVIEAQLVSGPSAVQTGSSVSAGGLHSGMPHQGMQGFMLRSGESLTYTRHGGHGAPAQSSGFFLDTYI